MQINGITTSASDLSGTTGTDSAAASAPTDLDSSTPIRTETTTTTDGKAVTRDILVEEADLTIARETTFDAAGNVASEQIVFETGGGSDAIKIDESSPGVASVDVNGQQYTATLPPSGDFQFGGVTVRSGSGNDVIEVASGAEVNLTADGGAGDDRIVGGAGTDKINGGTGDDTLLGGKGRDDLFGASGNDRLIGGDGDDIVYGGDGNDDLFGLNGNDYIEGGTGTDRLYGGNDNDVLSGGRGSDELYAGRGDDAVYTGFGVDTVNNGGGTDTVYGQTATDTITANKGASNTVVNVELNASLGRSSVVVEGSDEFVQRVQADLDMLAASPNGQQMLERFDQAQADSKQEISVLGMSFEIYGGHTVTIRELQSEANGFHRGAGGQLDAAGNPGTGASSEVRYNPSFSNDYFPNPAIVLFHELSHAFNNVTGTFQPGVFSGEGPGNTDLGINNRERQAVGLENDGVAFDGDNDPSTPDSTANPIELSENGLREEMGLPLRPSYSL